MNSNVLDLLNFIVYVTAFELLLDRVHGVLLDLDRPNDHIPVVATFENSDLRDASSCCDTTNIPVVVTQPTFHYSVQICYTILPMHWTTQQISPLTILLQNSYLLPHKQVPYSLILNKYPFWYPVYTMLFVIVTAVCLFQANYSLSYQHAVISSVNLFVVRVS